MLKTQKKLKIKPPIQTAIDVQQWYITATNDQPVHQAEYFRRAVQEGSATSAANLNELRSEATAKFSVPARRSMPAVCPAVAQPFPFSAQ
jgi:S1-C subfamily serine protease